MAPVSGRSSGVEHNLAKVGVEGSNPFARSIFQNKADQSNGFPAGTPGRNRAPPAGSLARPSRLQQYAPESAATILRMSQRSP